MCTVSNIGDSWKQEFPIKWPRITISPNDFVFIPKEDYDKLHDEIQQLKLKLEIAKAYDEATGQKDCEMADKIEFIQQIANAVDVNLDDVFGKNNGTA